MDTESSGLVVHLTWVTSALGRNIKQIRYHIGMTIFSLLKHKIKIKAARLHDDIQQIVVQIVLHPLSLWGVV